MMFLSTFRRAIHERDVGNSEGGALGGRGFPSGCGAGWNDWLFLRASSGVGGKHFFARTREAGTTGGATHSVAQLDELSESAGGCDPDAAACRGKSDSRSDRCAARAGPPKRTRPSPRDPHSGTKAQV